jgi:hypothetical protein
MRLVSALVALALLLAHAIGGYAHAAGHSHGKEASSCVHQEISATALSATSADAQSEQCQEPAHHIDAFDFMCNGGLAILVAPSVAFAPAKVAHRSSIIEIGHLLLAASLERPPKSAIRA